MKRRHLLLFYCTLLVPVTTLAGIAVGRATAHPVAMAVLGVGLGIGASALLLRGTASDETP